MDATFSQVLLFPAMKPTDEQAAKNSKKHLAPPLDAKPAAHGHASVESTSPPILNLNIVATGSSIFAGVNIGSPAGLEAVTIAIRGKTFVKDVPSKEDAILYTALSQIPMATLRNHYPHVFSYLSTLSQFSAGARLSWS